MTESGKNLEELFKPKQDRKLRFTHGDKEWVFSYRALTWEEHFNAVECAWETREVPDDLTGKTKLEPFFNVSKYYEDVLSLALTGGPGGPPPTRMELRMLDSEVVRYLVSVVPGPNLADKVAEAKKE